MSGPKLTRWFPSNTKPLRNRPGEYEASHTMKVGMRRWWNGRQWSKPYAENDTEDAKLAARAQPAAFQNVPWRGLAENPQEGPPAA